MARNDHGNRAVHGHTKGPAGSVKMGSTRTIPASGGQKAISFKEGGLHASTGTPAGQKISPAMHAKAASGALGPKAQKQEDFYRNVLKKG
jgi:hypothetical protein